MGQSVFCDGSCVSLARVVAGIYDPANLLERYGQHRTGTPATATAAADGAR
jgi:hypothetical protein